MDPALTRPPHTPPRAKSEGPTRPHRDSMEDADSSATRKRPRLDSGDRTYRSMSVDRLRDASTDSGFAKAPSTPPDGQSSSTPSEGACPVPKMSLTPSKVTINVRESAMPPQSTAPPYFNTTSSLRGGGGGIIPTVDEGIASKMDASSPNVISVDSSPPQSPEIEVAEVEDMNEEPGRSRWQPLTRATSAYEAGHAQQALFNEFPFGSTSRALRKTLAAIANAIEKSELENGSLFSQIADWIESYLEHTEPYSLHWCDMYEEARGFWDDFPSLLDALARRKDPRYGIGINYSTEGDENPLQSFLAAYASLAMRMALIDIYMLERHDNGISAADLVSERYINCLANIMEYRLLFWKTLIDGSRQEYKVVLTTIVSRLKSPPSNGIACMTQLSKEILELCHHSPGLMPKVLAPVILVNRIMEHYRVLQDSDAEDDKALLSPILDIPSQAYQMFLVVDSYVQMFISKQIPALTIEMSQNLIWRLSLLLRTIANSDEQLTRTIVSQRLALTQDVGDHGPALVEMAWKFETLKRCILEGRMEIRVHGVDTMDRDLVGVYNTRVKDSQALKDNPDHPIAQFLSDFLLANKLVDYFVGVESHPQLISRCGNIIGFLVVTRRYTEAETDVIWRAVTTSPDSRFVDALLNMLTKIFDITKYATLLYLTKKASELPIQNFDGPMIMFANKLLEYLPPKFKESLSDQTSDIRQREKWREPKSCLKMDMPPFHLCIRLIRESAAESSLEPQRKREIHHFANVQLRELLAWGPSDTDRRAIYDECLKDISGQTEYATGSISAIHALLSQNYEGEIALLPKDLDLPSLVVGEFAHMIEVERSSPYPSQMLEERLNVRLQLLQDIIMHVPSKITARTSTQLWNCAVGSEALNDHARESAWMCFIVAMRWPGNSRTVGASRNAFIDQCIRDHLPRLEPRFYTGGCLQFVQDVVHYHSRIAALRLDSDAKQDSTAVGLLWQLSLTAPRNTIENRAIGLLVAIYLDSPDVQRRTRAATEAIHIEVVERCIRQLTSAASKLKAFSDGTSSGEDEPMVIVVSDDEVQIQKLSFSRSLMILNEFVRGVRARSRYSPQVQVQRQLPHESPESRGDPIQIRYQAFGGAANSEIRTVEVGDLETIQEFASRLSSLTGFTKFNLINGGQRLELISNAEKTLRELKLDQKGLLLIKKIGTDAVPDLAPASGLRPVEKEILCHFPELYDLLTMEEQLGQEVFDFLKTFPPHSSITTLVCSKDTPLEAIFPATAPFKIRYSIYALKRSLEYQSTMGSTALDLIRHGIRSLTTALSSLNFNISSPGADLDISIAKDMVECLETFLKEPISNDSIDRVFANPLALINCLNTLITDALTIIDSDDAGSLVSVSFSVLLQISLLSEVMWSHFKDRVMCSVLFHRALLDEPRSRIRAQIADSIKGVRGASKTSSTVPARELVPYLWENLVNIIPFCLELADRSEDYSAEEFFDVVRGISESMDRASCEILDLPVYIQTWSAILLQHVHYEFVGRETKDWIVIGLSGLLKWCFDKLNYLGRPINISDDFLEKLFKTHLFPNLPDAEDETSAETRIPNLYTGTRHGLYEILLVMSNDMDNYQKLLTLVKNLLCQGEDFQAWSWGIAQPLEGYDLEPNFNFERNKYLRSELGYPGLRNLSNTCYMNSLFTQLFMNVRFRSFMLGTNVADGSSSQKLLHETQVLFGFMQETMLKAVDSQGIVDSLITYDNAIIDVSVQMDVDEFYNLLFDRWEGQILSSADKKKFRAFYGGQIVQQIKSKECDHISERLEPFSAIQCDIQGKLTLTDSLNAYVTGEVMEGDNKYACTSCGCYVDAVKRACLKNIPDNLIFHLKRFDYDVMTGMRSKINDRFEFPEQIDMAPYHVDHLKDPEQPSSPDMFELVGVLVHSGNAESGHYYSYIKERPPTYVHSKQWVEFNDTEVTKFNYANIPDQCFGGPGEHSPYTPRYLKSWNAYMLFYERMEPQHSDPARPISTLRGVPAKCEIPLEIERLVALNNSKWLRNYCLFDPAHAAFARQLLEQLRVVNQGRCSSSHGVEKSAIWQSLDYLQLVLARSKDSTGFGLMVTSLTNVIGACSSCCKLALEWVIDHESALRNVLLRCFVTKVRKDFSNMISVALRYLRKNDPEGYGFSKGDDVDIHLPKGDLRHGIFPAIVIRLRELWNVVLPQPRGWDDYFGLLTDLAKFGVHETHVLLNNGFLQSCLEVLAIDHPMIARLRSDHPHLAHYHRLTEKGRKFSFVKLTDFVSVLLSRVNLRAGPVRSFHDRPLDAEGMRLTKTEDRYLMLGRDFAGSKSCCVFLQKILESGGILPATKMIVQYMVLAEPEVGMLLPIQQTILNGVNVEPAHMAAPFLQAALSFCECTPVEASAEEVIKHIAREVDTIGMSGGREHLDFFIKARRLRSHRNTVSEAFFNQCVLKTVPLWAPALLMYCEESIRENTMDLLKTLVFGHDLTKMDDEEYAEMVITAGKSLQMACLRRCNAQIQQQKTIDGKTVQQVTAVIKHCLDAYCSEDDRIQIAEAENVLGSLEALTVSDLDEAASDTWGHPSDEMVSDSDSEYNVATSP